MKKLIALTYTAVIAVSAFSQKIKVQESTESIGGGNHNALVVKLFDVNPSDAEEEFKTFMKTYDGKRSSMEGAVFIDNAVITAMGNNTIDVYGKASGKKGDPEILFTVAFDLGGSFLSSSEHKAQYNAAEKIVSDFAIKTVRSAIEKQLRDNKKVQAKLEDEQKDLEKENRGLNSNIEDYKAKIKRAEDDVLKNQTAQDRKKEEIEAQKKIVGEIEMKLKGVN